eukprot:7742411-Lingulodinium_polyedra.AAC.1
MAQPNHPSHFTEPGTPPARRRGATLAGRGPWQRPPGGLATNRGRRALETDRRAAKPGDTGR